MVNQPQADLTQDPSHQTERTGKSQSPARFAYFWLTMGALVGLVLLTIMQWHISPSAPPLSSQADWQHIREQAWEKIQPRLQEADNATQTLADRSTREVEQFFAQHKAGVPGFAETVLSFLSKWTLIKSALPSADREGHRKFIAAQFAQHLFTEEDLQRVMDQAVSDYLHGIEGIENTLLVAIRADLADFPKAALPELQSAALFQSGYTRLMAAVETSVQADLHVDVVRESGSLVAGELAAMVTMQVATAVARRLGLSAGMLGTGAASSTVTFGAGLLVGIAVDIVAHRVSHWYYKPQEKLATQVVEALDRMQLRLIQGDAHTGGLQAELERLGTSRTTMRHVVLDHLIHVGANPTGVTNVPEAHGK